jgi:hypothetical protein
MTTRQPGVETDPDAMWSPALARGLIRDDVLRSMRYCDSYTDLLGPNFPARRSLAHHRVWRPIIAGLSAYTERQGQLSAKKPPPHYISAARSGFWKWGAVAAISRVSSLTGSKGTDS